MGSFARSVNRGRRMLSKQRLMWQMRSQWTVGAVLSSLSLALGALLLGLAFFTFLKGERYMLRARVEPVIQSVRLGHSAGRTACRHVLIDIGVQLGEKLAEFAVSSDGPLKAETVRHGLEPEDFCVHAFEAEPYYTHMLSNRSSLFGGEFQTLAVHTQSTVADFDGHLYVPKIANALSSSSSGAAYHHSTPSQVNDHVHRVVNDSAVSYNFYAVIKAQHDLAADDDQGETGSIGVRVMDIRRLLGARVRDTPNERDTGARIVRARVSLDDAKEYIRRIVFNPELCAAVDVLVLDVVTRSSILAPREEGAPPGGITAAASLLGGLPVEQLRAMLALMPQDEHCRTRVVIDVDEDTERRTMSTAASSSVVYAVLAGAPTFSERVGAASQSWFTALPAHRIGVFTDQALTDERLGALRGYPAMVLPPSYPDTEKYLESMQSWSHLVRLRGAWDHFMRDDPSAQYLALVDDDCFVMTDTMDAVLKNIMDPKVPALGGVLELARIDNDDGGRFGAMLRGMHYNKTGEWCTFDGEKPHSGAKECRHTMCRGCPAVPQGGSMVLTRALVEQMRPFIEQCEKDTQVLCKRCGSQRLYFCAHEHIKNVASVSIPGMFRFPWLYEMRKGRTVKPQYPTSFHSMRIQRNNPWSVMSETLAQEFKLLQDLARAARRRGAVDGGDPYVNSEDLSRAYNCKGAGIYSTNSCFPLLSTKKAWNARSFASPYSEPVKR